MRNISFFPLATRHWQPALCVATAVLIHLAMLTVYVAKQEGDLSVLVGVSEGRMGLSSYKYITRALGPGGYDGMFYYAIARRPWVLHVQGVDAPAARHLRVLYPALCWAVAGGDGRLLIYAMPCVNLALIGGLAYLGASLAVGWGRSAWWGLGLTLAVNVALPAMRDLTDCLSTLTVFGLLAAWLTRASSATVVLWAAAAMFSREQNLAVLALVAVAALAGRRPAVWVGVLAVLVLWLGWVAILRWAYGVWPFLTAQGNSSMPFGGLLYGWTHLAGPTGSTRLAICNGTSLFHWSALLAAGGYLAWRVPDRLVAGFLGLALLASIVAGPWIYDDLMSYRRVLVWLPLGVWLAGLRIGWAWPMGLLSLAPLWSMAAVLRYV